MSHHSCEELFQAGTALLAKSGLVRYCVQDKKFYSCEDKKAFEKYHRKKFHEEFGRYMAWVLFSVGAENLAKAACVCAGKIKAGEDHIQLSGYRLHLKKLNSCDAEHLDSGFKELERVRNRDAHAFRRNVRKSDFYLVEQEFVPMFNIMRKTMDHCGHFDIGQ